MNLRLPDELCLAPIEMESASVSVNSLPLQPLHTRSPTENPVHGYPRLAHHIGHTRGSAIFRRFATLNAKNLLYLQAEICDLEWELNNLEKRSSDLDRSYQYRVSVLRSPEATEHSKVQWEKVLEIRDKLKAYSEVGRVSRIAYVLTNFVTDEALLEHEKLYNLKEPPKRDLADLQDWLIIAEGGGGFLQDPENLPWNRRTRDLVQLSHFGDEDDAFSRFFRSKLLVWYAHSRFGRWMKPPSQFGTSEFSDKGIERLIKSFLVVFASLLPTMAIFALAYIPTQTWRIAFILLFSLFFTTCLSIFTKARAVEIFFATAALASVQVVFIGGNTT